MICLSSNCTVSDRSKLTQAWWSSNSNLWMKLTLYNSHKICQTTLPGGNTPWRYSWSCQTRLWRVQSALHFHPKIRLGYYCVQNLLMMICCFGFLCLLNIEVNCKKGAPVLIWHGKRWLALKAHKPTITSQQLWLYTSSLHLITGWAYEKARIREYIMTIVFCCLGYLNKMRWCYGCVPLERASAISNTCVPLECISVISNTVQLNLWQGSGLAKINCHCHCRYQYWNHAQWLARVLSQAKRRGLEKTSWAKRRRDLDHKLDRRGRMLHCWTHNVTIEPVHQVG